MSLIFICCFTLVPPSETVINERSSVLTAATLGLSSALLMPPHPPSRGPLIIAAAHQDVRSCGGVYSFRPGGSAQGWGGGVQSHQWTSPVRIRLSSFDPLIESARTDLHASIIVRSRSLSRSLSAHVLPARPIRSLRRVQWGRSLAAGCHQGALKTVSLKKEPTEALLVLLTFS